MRHGPMDWTVGTFGTVGNDSRRLGQIGDYWDSWERRRLSVTPRQASDFHCLFGPSQLRRPGPKRPRNTSVESALPRAARAFGAACPGLVCFALSALLPLRGKKCQAGQIRPLGRIWLWTLDNFFCLKINLKMNLHSTYSVLCYP